MLGTRIAEWRATARRTQGWVAETVGVSTRTVQNWESGDHDPRVGQFLSLVMALNVPEEDWRKALAEAVLS